MADVAGVILAADSDPQVLNFTAYVLRRRGYEVEVAVRACDAVRLVLDGLQPQLLVTGFIFGDTNGIALAQDIRCYVPNLPVLLVTTGAQELPPGISRRGFTVLLKPCLPQELLEAVATALGDTRSRGQGA